MKKSVARSWGRVRSTVLCSAELSADFGEGSSSEVESLALE